MQGMLTCNTQQILSSISVRRISQPLQTERVGLLVSLPGVLQQFFVSWQLQTRSSQAASVPGNHLQSTST